jgi:glutamyl-tRNA synthetase
MRVTAKPFPLLTVRLKSLVYRPMVVTRFAPSPTGFLHIGGARTALFNWLFAKHHGGKFLLRIEDTDRQRSTEAAVQAIFGGLTWLELGWDGEAISQFARRERHAEVARQLLTEGKAYCCYCTPEELAEMREQAKREGRAMMYDGRWRDRAATEAPRGIAPVIRFKAPRGGVTRIEDRIQGPVEVANGQLDDMVLLRADGTPTYMLAVVVDDHDMVVTHVIRGDDHLTNAFRQYQLYKALDWPIPEFAHLPLLHGADGAKLSKRHGAQSVEEYRDMGILPEAMCNYLLRLGWSHGNDEIIGRDQAIQWFDLDAVGRAPARFDMDKLLSLNAHYLRHAAAPRLIKLVLPELAKRAPDGLAPDIEERLAKGLGGLTERSKNILELADNALLYALKRPIPIDDKARKLLDGEGRRVIEWSRPVLAQAPDWTKGVLEERIRQLAADRDVKLGSVAQPLRAAITGSDKSPGIFEVMEVLGRAETLGRIEDALAAA